MDVFGKLHADNPQAAAQAAKEVSLVVASELLAVGIDLSLAPVLDVNKGVNTAIGSRAFHADPHTVAYLAEAFMLGMQEAGMAATAKHFPGHGSVTVDSHLALPIDERPLAEIEAHDLIPFRELINKGIAAVMAAHIVFNRVDKQPVGFSRVWLQDILQKQLGFQGVIISDDLNMEGANISTNYADRVEAARDAGCDLTLLCNNRPGVIQTLDQRTCCIIPPEKWRRLQAHDRTQATYQTMPRWQNAGFLLSVAEASLILTGEHYHENPSQKLKQYLKAQNVYIVNQINQALDRMAKAITAQLQDANPWFYA